MDLDTPAVRRLRDRLLEERPAGDSHLAEEAHVKDELTPEQEAALERVGPLIEVLYLTMAADGAMQAPERKAIRNAIGVLTDDLLPEAAVVGFLDWLEEVLVQQGRETRLEAIATRFALDKQDAEAAFTLAAAVALSDGHLDCSERELAEQLRRYFGIPRERAVALLEG